jgi:hypothetical protein
MSTAAGALLGVSPGTAELRAHSGGVDSAPIMVEVVAHVPAAATFTQVRAVTDARCAVAGCHVDGVEPGDLRFDREPTSCGRSCSRTAPRRSTARARRGGRAGGELRGPEAGPARAGAVGGRCRSAAAPMAAEEVQVIVRWILAGALND